MEIGFESFYFTFEYHSECVEHKNRMLINVSDDLAFATDPLLKLRGNS